MDNHLLKQFFPMSMPVFGWSWSGSFVELQHLNISLAMKLHMFPSFFQAFIQVAGEERQWRDGELLAFDDSCDHSARHDGEQALATLR